jgi:hypothetical protein
MVDQQQIDDEQTLLDIARRKMVHLRRHFVIKGSDAPFELFEDMRLAVAQIHKSKLFLRELGIMVADSLNDDLPTFSQPPLRVTEEPTPASVQAATSMELQPVVNGDLGFGLTIGGVHEGAELLALACPEYEYKETWVRSGWLYSGFSAGAYLAVAFFKMHRSPDNTGYIHIRDASSPPHIVWFKAPTPQYQQAILHYIPVNLLVNGIIQTATDSVDWTFTWL